MSEENTSPSPNYTLYAHIAELSVLAFSTFYFYRRCSALEDRISKLENVRVSETQEIDQATVDAIAAHVYARVVRTLNATDEVKVQKKKPVQEEVNEEETAVYGSEYKGSDRDLETELKNEL